MYSIVYNNVQKNEGNNQFLHANIKNIILNTKFVILQGRRVDHIFGAHIYIAHLTVIDVNLN